MGLDADEAWKALGDAVKPLEDFAAKLEKAVVGFYSEGSLRGDLAKALEKAGLDPQQASQLADEFQSGMREYLDKKKAKRISEIVRKYEPSEKKARVIEDGMIEAIALGGLNEDNIRQAIEAKYGIKSFTAQQIAEMNEMVNDAKDLPSDKLKRQKMIELFDYIQSQNGEDVADIVQSFWYAGVLFDTKTWASVS